LPGERDALAKGIELLSVLIEAGGDDHLREWGVRELGRTLSVSPASVYRLLAKLGKYGMVQRGATPGRYMIGWELYRLSLKLNSNYTLQKLGGRLLHELTALTGETSVLAVYDHARMERMFVGAAFSSQPLRYVVRLHEWLPVYAGAAGLAIMAFLPEEDRRVIIERTGLAAITVNTITDPIRLEVELASVRMQGYAFSRGQHSLGAVGIGAPVWGADGRVLGCVHLTMPEGRFEEEMKERYAGLVRECAAKLTKAIVGRKTFEEKKAATALSNKEHVVLK
jgi:IclR family acetate operon transcriptional repressor